MRAMRRSILRSVSKKRSRERYRERGLYKHEIKFRSQGGDPLDPNNCLMVCGKCSSKEHGIHES